MYAYIQLPWFMAIYVIAECKKKSEQDTTDVELVLSKVAPYWLLAVAMVPDIRCWSFIRGLCVGAGRNSLPWGSDV